MNRRLAESYYVVTRTGGSGFTRWEPSPCYPIAPMPIGIAAATRPKRQRIGLQHLCFYLMMLGEGLTADGH